VNRKQTKTLRAIFSDPIPADIAWRDNVSLLDALGATVSQGKGCRIRVLLHEQRAVFHEPHPERVTDKGAVKSGREFLLNSGIVIDPQED
jgi:hypothetical protein